MLLQEYSFDIRYVPGVKNVVPDALTRIDSEDPKLNKNRVIEVNIMREETGIFSLSEILKDQKNVTAKERRNCNYKMI